MIPQVPAIDEELPEDASRGPPHAGVYAEAEAAWVAFDRNVPEALVAGTGEGTAPLPPRGQSAGVANGAARLEDALCDDDDDAGLVELLAAAAADRPPGQPRLDQLAGGNLTCCDRGCLSKLWYGGEGVDGGQRRVVWAGFGELQWLRASQTAEVAGEPISHVGGQEREGRSSAPMRRAAPKPLGPTAGFEKSLIGGYQPQERKVDALPDRSEKAIEEASDAASMERRLRTASFQSATSSLAKVEEDFGRWLHDTVRIGGHPICVYGTIYDGVKRKGALLTLAGRSHRWYKQLGLGQQRGAWAAAVSPAQTVEQGCGTPGCNCLRNVHVGTMQMFMQKWAATAGAETGDTDRWQCVAALIRTHCVCDLAVVHLFGCSGDYVQRVRSVPDHAPRPQHGNTCRAPPNKKSEWTRQCIQSCLDIYTQCDPDPPVGAELVYRRWCIDDVHTMDMFADRFDIEFGAALNEDIDRVTIKRIAGEICAETGTTPACRNKTHNKCWTCKSFESKIETLHVKTQKAKGGRGPSAPAGELSWAEQRAKVQLQYRWHNGHDYRMRGHFNHVGRWGTEAMRMHLQKAAATEHAPEHAPEPEQHTPAYPGSVSLGAGAGKRGGFRRFDDESGCVLAEYYWLRSPGSSARVEPQLSDYYELHPRYKDLFIYKRKAVCVKHTSRELEKQGKRGELVTNDGQIFKLGWMGSSDRAAKHFGPDFSTLDQHGNPVSERCWVEGLRERPDETMLKIARENALVQKFSERAPYPPRQVAEAYWRAKGRTGSMPTLQPQPDPDGTTSCVYLHDCNRDNWYAAKGGALERLDAQFSRVGDRPYMHDLYHNAAEQNGRPLGEESIREQNAYTEEYYAAQGRAGPAAGPSGAKKSALPKRTTAYNHFRAEFPDRAKEWAGIKKAAGDEFRKFKAMEVASETPIVKSKQTPTSTTDFEKGARVQAVYPENGDYYPATVTKVNTGKTKQVTSCQVQWDDDESFSTVKVDKIFPLDSKDSTTECAPANAAAVGVLAEAVQSQAAAARERGESWCGTVEMEFQPTLEMAHVGE
jgi:hypothetical protein